MSYLIGSVIYIPVMLVVSLAGLLVLHLGDQLMFWAAILLIGLALAWFAPRALRARVQWTSNAARDQPVENWSTLILNSIIFTGGLLITFDFIAERQYRYLVICGAVCALFIVGWRVREMRRR